MKYLISIFCSLLFLFIVLTGSTPVWADLPEGSIEPGISGPLEPGGSIEPGVSGPIDIEGNIELGETGSLPSQGSVESVSGSTSVCSEQRRIYPQCGATVGLEGFRSGHTVMVTEVKDCRGNILRYENDDIGPQSGQCGNTVSSQPPQQVAQQPVAQPVLVTTCKGTLTLDDLRNQLRGANFPGPFDNIPEMVAAFDRAACPSPVGSAERVVVVPATPTPAPIQSGPAPRPRVIVVQPTPTPVVVVRREVIPPPSAVSPDRIGVSCPGGSVATLSGSTVVCVSQSAAPISISNVNQNTNTVSTDRNPVVFAVNPQPTTLPVVVAQPQVVTQPQVVQVSGTSTQVKELPKTGLPAAAVFLTGLIPLGAFFRRFGTGGGETQEHPFYLFQKREFEKDS